MKKSVLLMAGLLTVALAGSAQAAPMFAVQDGNANDKFTVDAAGMVNAEGQALQTGGKVGITLSNAPAVAGFSALSGPYGPFHVATKGNAGSSAAFIAQNVTTGAGTYPVGVAPSFSFYRINQHTSSLAYALPQLDDALGFFQFGSLNTTVDPNTSASRKNAAKFSINAENAWTSITDTPTYFSWLSTTVGSTLVERMRLSSAGNLGIGTIGTPTSKLQVVGLPVCADETGLPVPAGLTSGAFYRTPAGVVRVAP